MRSPYIKVDGTIAIRLNMNLPVLNFEVPDTSSDASGPKARDDTSCQQLDGG